MWYTLQRLRGVRVLQTVCTTSLSIQKSLSSMLMEVSPCFHSSGVTHVDSGCLVCH